MANNVTTIKEVSIEVGNKIYARLESMSNTPVHVLAEFIDNAIQSYLDHKEELLDLEPQYKLKVDINFEWKERLELSSVTIKDNAAGMSQEKFVTAFALAHTPDSTSGLNEFGMGMKTAALWIGRAWKLKSTALGEDVERTVCFDLNNVVGEERKTIPVLETINASEEHGTEIVIRNFTKNAPSLSTLPQVNLDLASIYRQYLRNDELSITVNGQVLRFEEYPILDAPYVKTPDADSKKWKKEIDFSFDRYKAKGFIAILSEMNKSQNGLVLLRRGRVVVGAEEGKRFCPKVLFGNVGSPRYKRLFGELELEGFSVSFNKDDVQEKENLEALMNGLKGEIHTRDFDLYAQAEDYRPDDTKKKVDRVARGHMSVGKSGKKPSSTSKKLEELAAKTSAVTSVVKDSSTIPHTQLQERERVINNYEDTFELDGTDYTMKVLFVDVGSDLLSLNIQNIDKNEFECRINAKHPFFNVFSEKKIDKSAIAILRAMAMAKFSAKKKGDDKVSEMFIYFNNYIRDIGV